MHVYLTALGCRLNEAELEAWSRGLDRDGHRVVGRPADADVLVLNTCAVTAEASRKSRKLARRLHRQNPEAQLVLTGCFAALEPERAAEIAGVDLVIGNHDKDTLLERIASELDLNAMPARARDDDQSQHLYRSARTRAFVKVQDGCRNRCTFCIVTVARGAERSVPVDEVVTTVDDLCRRGHREVVLSGVHLGGYGDDIDADLRQLVAAVLERTAVQRLRLSSLEPWDLPEGFFSLWRDRRLCPHLHLPLQSGSDRVLRRMARRTSNAAFRAIVDEARATVPDLTLTTDVIVGFPGETRDDFEQTLQLCDDVGFAHVHIFPFSPRDGTAAARMADAVDEDAKRARSRELHALAARHKRATLEAAVGTRREVLFEGASEPTERGTALSGGLTDNYLRVVVEHGPRELENHIAPCELRGVNDAGDTLVGALVATARGEVAAGAA